MFFLILFFDVSWPFLIKYWGLGAREAFRKVSGGRGFDFPEYDILPWRPEIHHIILKNSAFQYNVMYFGSPWEYTGS